MCFQLIITYHPPPPRATILLTGLLAGGYTAKGGMVAVVYTDFMQSVALVLCAIIVLALAVHKIPDGFGGMFHLLRENGRTLHSSFFVPDPLAGQRSSPPKESLWGLSIGYAFTSFGQLGTDQSWSG